MSKHKRAKYQQKRYESVGETFIDRNGTKRTDTFASIYESMLQSPAWHKLTYKQKILYVICKAQITGKRKPKHDLAELDLCQENECFYLNINSICKDYRMYGEKDTKFYKDMKVLEKNGFIKRVLSGRHNHSKNVYKLVSDWQDIK